MMHFLCGSTLSMRSRSVLGSIWPLQQSQGNSFQSARVANKPCLSRPLPPLPFLHVTLSLPSRLISYPKQSEASVPSCLTAFLPAAYLCRRCLKNLAHSLRPQPQLPLLLISVPYLVTTSSPPLLLLFDFSCTPSSLLSFTLNIYPSANSSHKYIFITLSFGLFPTTFVKYIADNTNVRIPASHLSTFRMDDSPEWFCPALQRDAKLL